MGFLSTITGGAVKDEGALTEGANSFFSGVTGSGNPVLAFYDAQIQAGKNMLGLGGKGPGASGLTEADRQYLQLRQKQHDEAKKFRADIPTFQSQLGENIDQDIRGRLSSDLASSQVDASRRGLLRSGIHQGRDLGYRAQAGAESATKRSQLARELNTQADAYDQAVVDAGRSAYMGDVEKSDRAYKEALDRRQNETGMLKGLMGGAGSLTGAYLGGKK